MEGYESSWVDAIQAVVRNEEELRSTPLRGLIVANLKKSVLCCVRKGEEECWMFCLLAGWGELFKLICVNKNQNGKVQGKGKCFICIERYFLLQ